MFTYLLRTTLGLTLLLTGFTTPLMPAGLGSQAVAPPPAVEFVDMPDELADMATWATGLFEQAGLDLPPLRFVHHGGDMAPCSGRGGVHRPQDGVNVIEICTDEISMVTEILILHETAHAWSDNSLTPERKAAFQAVRGWEHWRNYEAAGWHENGTEQAAEIMVWGLFDRPIEMVRIGQSSCDELEAGYLALTGDAPLHGFRSRC